MSWWEEFCIWLPAGQRGGDFIPYWSEGQLGQVRISKADWIETGDTRDRDPDYFKVNR